MAKGKLITSQESVTKAKDIMSSVLIVMSKDQTFRMAVELLTQKKLTVLPVVDPKGKLLGLLSEKDILAACSSFDESPQNFLDEKIRYQTSVKTVSLETPLDEVGKLLQGAFRHIPVVDNDNNLRGIITRRDLIRIIYLRLELNGRIASDEV